MFDVFSKEKAAGCLLTDHLQERRIHSHMLTNTEEGCTSREINDLSRTDSLFPGPQKWKHINRMPTY